MNAIVRAARAYNRCTMRIWYAMKDAIRRVPYLGRALEDVGVGLLNFGRTVDREPWVLGVLVLVGIVVLNAARGDMEGMTVGLVSLASVTAVVAAFRHWRRTRP